MPKISVIVPVYNVEHYLSKCLDSLVTQSFDDFEIIIVDDGSTDNTISILKDWSKTNDLEWYTGEHLNVQFGFYDLMWGENSAFVSV